MSLLQTKNTHQNYKWIIIIFDMGRNPRALHKADRIDPHPKKPSARPHKRRRTQEASEEPEEQGAHVLPETEIDMEDARVESLAEEMSDADGMSDGESGEDGNDGDEDMDDEEGDGEGEASEVFTVGRSVHEAEDKPKRTGSVLRSAKVPCHVCMLTPSGNLCGAHARRARAAARGRVPVQVKPVSAPDGGVSQGGQVQRPTGVSGDRAEAHEGRV